MLGYEVSSLRPATTFNLLWYTLFCFELLMWQSSSFTLLFFASEISFGITEDLPLIPWVHELMWSRELKRDRYCLVESYHMLESEKDHKYIVILDVNLLVREQRAEMSNFACLKTFRY